MAKDKIEKNRNIHDYLKILNKNYAFVIAVFTTISVVFANLLRLYEYTVARLYFNYYGINQYLYDYSNQTFFYYIFYSITVMVIAIASFLSLNNGVKVFIKLKKNNILIRLKSSLFYFLITIILNIIISFIDVKTFSLSSIFFFIIITIIEFVYALPDNKKKSNIIYPKSKLMVLLYYISIIILISLFANYMEFKNKRTYSIIDDSKSIVYSSKDYYITIECEISDNKLILYKGSTTKVPNDNVKTQYRSFDTVELRNWE